MKIQFIFTLTVILISCNKPKEDSYIVPVKLKSYLDNFVNEGAKRGIKLNLQGIKIEFIDHPPISGAAGDYDPNNNCIYIDTTSTNYKAGSDYIEQLLFHELGHAILKRGHRDDFLNCCDPASIMSCCNIAHYFGDRIYKREYYINELFNENTPDPLWKNNP